MYNYYGARKTESQIHVLDKKLFELCNKLFEDVDFAPNDLDTLTEGELQVLNSLLKRKFSINLR